MDATAQVDIGKLIYHKPTADGGRRACVSSHIAIRHLDGQTPEQMIASNPGLSLDLVHAGLAYYYANKSEIDTAIDEDRRAFEDGTRKS